MSHIENELSKLKEDVSEMMSLVKSQLTKAKDALFNNDKDLAHEVMNTEMRVDVLELSIDKYCSRIIALMGPVATDLRFIIAMIKMISSIERIGDNAEGIAKIVADCDLKLNKEIISKLRINEMFEISLDMMEKIYDAYLAEDASMARKVFKKDRKLDEIDLAAKATIVKLTEDGKIDVYNALNWFSIIRKLERTGDLLKNIGEEIIYHIEARFVKHKQSKKLLG